MTIDKEELEVLLKQAGEPIGGPPPPPKAAPPAASRAPAAPPRAPSGLKAGRVAGFRVPVVVRLINERMSIGAIRKFSQGTILELPKHVDDPLQLLANNFVIAFGQTVRIGEHFGLRVTRLAERHERSDA